MGIKSPISILADENGDFVGTDINPLRTDPTGDTAQPVTDNGGSLTVDGTVAATQSGSWTTEVTQATASSLNATVVGAGTAGTPNSGVLTVQGIAGGTEVIVSAVQDDITTSTIAANGVTVTSTDIQGRGSVTIQITGTWVGTLQFEGTVNGSTFVSLGSRQPNSGTISTSTTANGLWRVSAAGLNLVRVRSSAWTSGTATVTIRESASTNSTLTESLPTGSSVIGGVTGSGNFNVVGPGAAGAATSGNPVRVGASDGTNTRNILSDTSGRLLIVGAGTAGTPVGGVVSMQGVSGGQALAIADGGGSITIDASSLPLPTGAATETTLASIDTKTPALGQAAMAASVPVALASDQTAIPITDNGSSLSVDDNGGSLTVDATSWPLPTGAATEATLSTLSSTASSINTKTPALGQAVMASSVPVTLASNQTGVPVTDNGSTLSIDDGGGSLTVDATSWPLPTGAATETTLAGVLTTAAFQARVNTLGQKTMTNSTPVVLSSDQTVIPVSDNGGSLTVDATSWPLPTGASTETTLSAINTKTPALGQATMANSSPVVLASNQTSIPVTDNGGSLTVDGAVTVTQGTAAALSGYWPVRVTDGTNTMPTGDAAARALFHRITDGTSTAAVKAASTPAVGTDPALVVAISPNNTLPISIAADGYGGQVEGRAASGAALVGNPVLIGGVDDTFVRSILVDSLGRIITAPAGSSSSVTPGLAPGYVATAATTRVAVRSTAYTEQAANAQRSVVSANAADTAAGTGARTVRITYYTSTFTGPFTTTVTMNGTTAVNTSVSDICYIEKMEVMTVGSGGQNAGIISLRTTTGGGGSTFASIAVGDNETFYAHHYVADGVTAYVTGMSAAHNGTVVGSGGLFIIRAQSLNTANAVDDQIGDFLRLYGQSSTVTRVWGTAIKVFGPARITVYVTPEASSSLIYRSSIDFYDQ